MSRAGYRVSLTKQAQKELAGLQSARGKALARIAGLRDHPRKGFVLQGLSGSRVLKFSLPGGEYRAVCLLLEETRECLVYCIGSRENFYNLATRRYRALIERLR